MDWHDVPDRAAGGVGPVRDYDPRRAARATATWSPGRKIFITWGDHAMTDNIVHLVLARLPDAPQGTKGISLFVVPKFKLDADGTPGDTQ